MLITMFATSTAMGVFFFVLSLAYRPSGFAVVLGRAERARGGDPAEKRKPGEVFIKAMAALYGRGKRLVPVATLWDTNRFRALEEVEGRGSLTPEALCASQVFGLGLALPLAASLVIAGRVLLGMFTAVAVAVFALGPTLVVRSELSRQKAAMTREALVLAEFTSVGVAAGLSPWEALREAVRGGDGPLFRKVRYALAEGESMVGGRQRTASLAALAEKLEIPEFTSFVELFSQAVEYGAEGFVKAIDDTVRHIRELRRAKIESIAQKAQSKMIVPLMLFLIALMVFLIGPMFSQVFSMM